MYHTFNEEFKKRIDQTTTAGYIYFGIAFPNAPTDGTHWIIQKINATTGDTDIAGGVANFSQIWDNRASLEYS